MFSPTCFPIATNILLAFTRPYYLSEICYFFLAIKIGTLSNSSKRFCCIGLVCLKTYALVSTHILSEYDRYLRTFSFRTRVVMDELKY